MVNLSRLVTPTEVDHYQIQREIDVYVSPAGERPGKVASRIDKLVKNTKLPAMSMSTFAAMVLAMRQSFKSFAIGPVAGGGAALSDSGGAVQLV